jgi:hypothetical protein
VGEPRYGGGGMRRRAPPRRGGQPLLLDWETTEGTINRKEVGTRLQRRAPHPRSSCGAGRGEQRSPLAEQGNGDGEERGGA